MTPDQETMFKLQNTPDPARNIPGEIAQAGQPQWATSEVDVVSYGLAMTAASMAANGPNQPIQRGPAKTMTKAQLEEQKMNEASGLPSNLDEAARVIALERQVQNVDSKLDQIQDVLCRLTPAAQATFSASAPDALVLPPTPLERHDVEQSVQQIPSQQSSQQAQTLTLPDLVTEPPTKVVVATPEFAHAFSTSETPVEASPETPSDEYVTLDTADGPVTVLRSAIAGTEKPESVGSLSLGPVGSSSEAEGDEVLAEGRFELSEDVLAEVLPIEQSAGSQQEGEPCADNPIGDQGLTPEDLIEKEVEGGVSPEERKRLERTQILADQVVNWLKLKDPEKYFKRFLARTCNVNLAYSTWPTAFKGPFDARFAQMLADPHFTANVCGRILKMQNGHLVACHVAGAFVTVLAGMLSFALLEE